MNQKAWTGMLRALKCPLFIAIEQSSSLNHHGFLDECFLLHWRVLLCRRNLLILLLQNHLLMVLRGMKLILLEALRRMH